MSEANQEQIIEELKKEVVIQLKIIAMIKEFFSSNSEFMKLYRQRPEDYSQRMKSILDNQEKIFSGLFELVKSQHEFGKC